MSQDQQAEKSAAKGARRSVHDALSAPGLTALGLTSVGVLLVVVLWAMVNALSWRHYERLDWTSDRLYSLSERSESLLASLDRDVEFVAVLDPQSPAYPLVDELLDRMVAKNPQRLARRDLDPALDPLEARRLIEVYGIERGDVVVVAAGDDRRVVDAFDMVTYDYAGAGAGQGGEIREFVGEAKLVSALLSLLEDRKPRLVLTTGHGEATLEPGGGLGRFAALLGADNFEIEAWASRDGGPLPAGTDLLAILGPRSAFSPEEVAEIEAYLDAGGRVLAALDPVIAPEAIAERGEFIDLGLGPWLARTGIALGDDVVIDPTQALQIAGGETFVASRYGSHPIVEALDQTGTPTVFSLARSLRLTPGAEADRVPVTLIEASSSAWGETDLTRLDQVAADGVDRQGPFPLAVALSFPAGVDGAPDPARDEARLLVLGDLDWLSDTFLGLTGGNELFATNAFNWLIERDALVEIEGRAARSSRLILLPGQLYGLAAIFLLLMPGLAVAAGVWIAFRRRR